MDVVRTIDELDAALMAPRRDHRIGFVPTMGALHAGHVSLVDIAASVSDVVVVSIFVNPLQFGPTEDLARYPRDEEGDIAKLEGAGVDVVFLPTMDEMYPPGSTTTVDPGPLGEVLEGAERPGHFRGVCTIVVKLFAVVRPNIAVFGQKDAQQLAVIKKMVTDLSIPIEIVAGPTVREPDGLALSSRNAYLTDEERRKAPVLYRALQAGQAALINGADVAAKTMHEALAEVPGIEPSYARAVDPETFGPPEPNGEVLLVVAARVGTTRLIDNLLVDHREVEER